MLNTLLHPAENILSKKKQHANFLKPPGQHPGLEHGVLFGGASKPWSASEALEPSIRSAVPLPPVNGCRIRGGNCDSDIRREVSLAESTLVPIHQIGQNAKNCMIRGGLFACRRFTCQRFPTPSPIYDIRRIVRADDRRGRAMKRLR